VFPDVNPLVLIYDECRMNYGVERYLGPALERQGTAVLRVKENRCKAGRLLFPAWGRGQFHKPVLERVTFTPWNWCGSIELAEKAGLLAVLCCSMVGMYCFVLVQEVIHSQPKRKKYVAVIHWE